MENKKTKYVLSGTDEEVVLGDTITTVFSKDLQNGGKITRNIEFDLTEHTLSMALSLGIIEIAEEKKEVLNVFENEPVEKVIEDHEQMIDYLLDIYKETHNEICKLKELVQDIDKNTRELKKIFSISTDGDKNCKCATQTV